MVKAGELGGVLELVLNRLAEFQEKAEKNQEQGRRSHVLPRRGHHHRDCFILSFSSSSSSPSS